MLRAPLNNPGELTGRKIRVPNSPLYVGTFKAMGALPTPLPFGDVYSALQQGVVDGAENSVSAYYAYKFHEVAKHYYFSNHMLGPGIFVASARALQRLPEGQRAVLTKTGAEAAMYHRRVEWEESEKMMNLARAAGASFNTVDIAPWAETARKIYPEYEERIGKDVMTQLRSAIGSS
jgi:TRAP-type C4-dicarboxylate transport system substrate-binding protein